MAELTSPRATRTTIPRWLDARLAVGVLLVLIAVVVGSRVFASAGTMTPVFVAAHDLVAGQHIGPGDLAVGHVRLDGQGGYYLSARSAPPDGYVVTRFVGAHEFVPAAALAATAAGSGGRLVTVPVQPGHLSAELARGALVDVYLTAKTGAGSAVPAPQLVLSAVPVESRDGGSGSFSGSTVSVVLAVPAGNVEDIVHAVESGTIDLVALPPTAAAGVRSATGGGS